MSGDRDVGEREREITASIFHLLMELNQVLIWARIGMKGKCCYNMLCSPFIIKKSCPHDESAFSGQIDPFY